METIEYNVFRKPGMLDNSYNTLNGIPIISVICQASVLAVEDRKTDADAHLAAARSQNTGTGILGMYKR